jgi:hypothetical protein
VLSLGAAAIMAYLASSSIDRPWYIPASTLPFFVLAAVAARTTRRRGEKEWSITRLVNS